MLSWLFSDPLPVGTVAPEFTAFDDAGNGVTLSALRGRNVVLVFYPGDETPVCRKQLCEIRDNWTLFEARNAVVYGVNPRGASSHSAFRSNRKLPFPLLVDAGRKVANMYRSGGLIIRRTVYLVGPDGVILYARRGNPSTAEILQAAA
ncbi:MAG: peroxiredoxin [Bryobacterales bacterium]|nr:peroxiredoxin [Bryobacterales bacterium]